jgi:hypothetical protein
MLTFWLVFFLISARADLPSTLPAELRAPASQKLILKAHGVGDQVYICQAVEGNYAWTLKAPDARLLDADGRQLGRHFAGPTWEAKDGSSVVGKPVANVPSPDPRSVPWLRLDAVRHDGSGAMSQVLSIQRLNTNGGKAPTQGCANSQVGAEVRVPYQADYYFYGNGR